MSMPWQTRISTTCAVNSAIAFPQLQQCSDSDDTQAPLRERVLSNLTPSDSNKRGAEPSLRISTSLPTPHVDDSEQHPLRKRRGITRSCLRIRTAQPKIGVPLDVVGPSSASDVATDNATPPPLSPSSTQAPREQPSEVPSSAISVTESSWSMILSQSPLSLSALPSAPDSARSVTSMDGDAAWKLRSALRDDARHLFEAKWIEAESLNSFVHSSYCALMMLSGQSEEKPVVATTGVDIGRINVGLKHVSLPSPSRRTPSTPRAGSIPL